MVRVGFSAWLNARPGLLIAGQAADGAEAVTKSRQHVQAASVRRGSLSCRVRRRPDARHRLRCPLQPDGPAGPGL
jgi:hypothetical protein